MVTIRKKMMTRTRRRSRMSFSQSLKAILMSQPEGHGYPSPEDVSPSPICSSSVSESSLSPLSSSPTKQRSSYTPLNGNKNDSRVEVDDYTKLANHFGSFSLSQGLEQKSNFQQGHSGQPIISQQGSPESATHSLVTRPKPYSAFLADVDKHEFEAEIKAWKRAKEEAIMNRLEKKEAVISDWEFRHICKAKEEMTNLENKLDKKRAKALEKLEKKIRTTKSEANKRARKARQLTKKKLSEISKLTIKARATKDLSCLKL